MVLYFSLVSEDRSLLGCQTSVTSNSPFQSHPHRTITLDELLFVLQLSASVLLKMTLTWITVFIVTAVLLWRPVLMEKRRSPSHFCLQNGRTISVLNVPPFSTTSSKSGEMKGILGEFLSLILQKCFIEPCKLSKNAFKSTLFNSTVDFISTLHENKTIIAFPISRPMRMSLSDDSYTESELVFEVFIKSPGYSLIMDVNNINLKTNELIFASLIENSWPIVVFTLLIAGISGMVIWILVRRFN